MAALALTAALAFPVNAHTGVELREWDADWQRRVVDAGLTVFDPTAELMAELVDMRRRHASKPRLIVAAARVVAPVARPPSPGVEAWRPLVTQFFPPDLVELALKVISCESGGDPWAHNPSGASGLFQHMPQYWADRSAKAGWAGSDIYNPTANVAVAAWLATSDGWHHWNPSRRCWS